MLGDRLVVITDKDDILSSNTVKNSWDKIKRIVESRGYYFDSDVESEAYGEYCTACVSAGAGELNIAGGLNRKTVVKTDITDLSIPGRREQEIEQLQRERLLKKSLEPEDRINDRLDFE